MDVGNTTQNCSLADRQCVPCRGDVPPLQGEELARWQAELGNEWQLVDGHHLTRTFRLRNFKEALACTNRIGELAEQFGHHPVIELAWGRVTVALWTHKTNGLADADFILAAKIDRLALLQTSA